MNRSPHPGTWQREFMQLMAMTRFRLAALSRSYTQETDEGLHLEHFVCEPPVARDVNREASGSGKQSHLSR